MMTIVMPGVTVRAGKEPFVCTSAEELLATKDLKGATYFIGKQVVSFESAMRFFGYIKVAMIMRHGPIATIEYEWIHK